MVKPGFTVPAILMVLLIGSGLSFASAESIALTKNGNSFTVAEGQYSTSGHCGGTCPWIEGNQVILGVYSNDPNTWTGGTASWDFILPVPAGTVESAQVRIVWPAFQGKGLHSISSQGKGTLMVGSTPIGDIRVNTVYTCPGITDYFAHPCASSSVTYPVPIQALSSTTRITASVNGKTLWDIGEVQLLLETSDSHGCTPQTFTVSGTRILHGTEPVSLKGIYYSPWPSGGTPVWGDDIPDRPAVFQSDLVNLKRLGANFVILPPQKFPPSFFNAMDNVGMLYAQEIFVDGSTEDLLDEGFLTQTKSEIRSMIDYTHSTGRTGNLVFFIIGDEINAGTIYRTDTRHPSVTTFHGNYISLTGATPSEVAIAQLIDYAMEYECTTHNRRSLYTHSSWTHIGPVNHPDLEVTDSSLFFADFGDLIAMNIYTYARGVTTSQPGSITGRAYQGYVEDLASLSQKPIVITQVGLSTSSVPDPLVPGFGGNTEEEQAQTFREVWEDIVTAQGHEKYAGITFFEYTDEWWKGTPGTSTPNDQNTHENDDPEEWFGLYQIGYADERIPKDPSVRAIMSLFIGTRNRAVFRSTSQSNWIVDYGRDGVVDYRDRFGRAGDILLVGDVDNDGTSDRAGFRAGEWIIDYSRDGSVNKRDSYGMAGDIPLIGRFNADGITDRAVFRNGQWIIDHGIDRSVNARNYYGQPGDIPLIGDFNNDGISDRAVFRPSAWNNWIIDYNMNGSTDTRNHFGTAGDIPIIGNFNGDAITDRAVFRSGEWIIDYNMDGTVNLRPRFGQAGDIPLVWNL